jgi:putative phosphoesterase
MRTALVSDIHGNLTALDAVIADLESVNPDLVVLGGDLVLDGTRPAEVVDRVRELGWLGVLGNSDEMVCDFEAAPIDASARARIKPQIDATRGLLGDERIQWLRSLPRAWKGDGIGLVHATPGNLWVTIPIDAEDTILEETFGPLGTAIAVYAHIHRPYVRYLPNLTVANTGSVGRPLDGDTRASYLLVENGEPKTRRVAYDLECELAYLAASGFPVAEAEIEARRRAAPPRRPEGVRLWAVHPENHGKSAGADDQIGSTLLTCLETRI